MMTPKEIKIPVPWGFLAAKTWGDERYEPVIALHGYQDNANAFDRLIPLLPKCFYYICVDLPSHGKSSHIETKAIPTHLDFILTLKLLLDYLNRQKYILMGHSVSTRFGTLFTLMYPEYVRALIALDATFYIPIEPQPMVDYYRDIINEYIKQLEYKTKKSAPSYSLDEAVDRMLSARFSTLSEEGAKILMERALIPVGNGKYQLSTAQHLKYCPRFPFSMNYLIELFEKCPLSCPHLIILAKDGEGAFNTQILDIFKRNKKCQVFLVEGEHDVHLDNPDRIAPILNKFLLNLQSCKL